MLDTNIFLTVEFQMSLLLFFALAAYLLASRINQSAIVGEILVGIIIGPSLLGLITYTDFVRNIAHLGAVILLFVVGLEFKLKDIFNIKYTFIALIGVIIPWIGGYFTAILFGFSNANAIFVGTALTATSIAITASVLKEMNLLHTDVAKAIIGAAVIDDILSLLVLSFSGQIVLGSVSFLSIILIIVKSLLFIIVGAFVGNTFLTQFIAKIETFTIAKKFPEFIFIFAMMIAFLYALIAESIHLSAIVGSFLAGVALEGVVSLQQKNSEVNVVSVKDFKEGAEYLRIIFGSLFFISLGILADFKALNSTIILFIIMLTVIAILTKVIGCFIPAKLQGMSFKDSLIVGFGMSPRGEVAMIVALLGLNAGIIGQDLYVSIVLMSLLTTLAMPLFFRHFSFEKNV